MNGAGKKSILQVNIPEHLRGAIGANVIRVTTTGRKEVIIDFVFVHPQDIDSNGNRVGTLVSRVVIPIDVAKDLQVILGNQLGKIVRE